MKKITILLSCLLILSLLFAKTSVANETFSIYLVRHAEKQTTPKRDPLLTECGIKRANQIAAILKDVEIKRVLSTDYKRTQLTAKPTAIAKKLKVEFYDPRVLPNFAKTLLSSKQNTLVVGHSNTTNVVAGLLSGQKIPQLDEKDFDKFFQVVVSPTGTILTTFHQGFSCTKN